MSYDLRISLPSWPSDTEALWIEELRLIGIEAKLPVDLALVTAAGWLPVTVTITPTSSIPYAREFRALGTFSSGFEINGSADHVVLSAKSSDGNAVAVWCAAALAAVTRGTLEDPQVGITTSGARAAEILATLMGNVEFVRSFCGPEGMAALPQPKITSVTRPPAAARPAIAADLTRPPRAYAASARYEVGDRVGHPTFGEGIVEISEPGKLTVFFPGGRRMLVQSKDGATAAGLSHPPTIDHSRPTPGSKKPR